VSFDDFWRKGHAFMPFLLPVPTPETDPQDSADTSISFNSEWAPYVLGALKVLTRPETWKGPDQATIELTIQRVMTWLAVIEDFSALCPAFYVGLTQDHCSWDTDNVDFQAIDTGDCPGQEREYSADCSTGLSGSVAKVGVGMFKVSDDTPCGGLVDELYVHVTDDHAVGNVFTIEGRDCLDNDLFEIVAGNTFTKTDFSCKWLCITGLANFSADFGISGPVLCEEA
jgi:hypothetical protein